MDMQNYLAENGLIKKQDKEFSVEKLTHLVKTGHIKETSTGIKISVEKRMKRAKE